MRYLCVLVLLVGCATPEQRAAREALYIAELEKRCVKIGFKPESPEMAHCKLSLMNSDEASANARAGVAAQNVANMREATKLKVTPPPAFRTY